MIKCYKCKITKPFLEFYKNSRKISGHGNMCRICSAKYGKQWYINNRIIHKKNAAKRKRELRNKWETVRKTLTIECGECGEDHFACLEFHHVSSREMSVRDAFMWSEKRFKEELSKCIVLCANCHRKKHYEEK